MLVVVQMLARVLAEAHREPARAVADMAMLFMAAVRAVDGREGLLHV